MYTDTELSDCVNVFIALQTSNKEKSEMDSLKVPRFSKGKLVLRESLASAGGVE